MVDVENGTRKYQILAAMGGVLGLIMLDETVVGVALPTIRRDLSMSLLSAHWVVNVYLLVFASFSAAAGKLGDIIGQRLLFLISISIFGLSSLACGFAQNSLWLMLARAAQGIGAAGMLPVSLAIISLSFSQNQRGMALGIYSAIGTVFLALGPLVGGFFTEVFSWRWIFWINGAIIIVIIPIVLILLHEPLRLTANAKFDFTGLLTMVSGLGLLVFAMMQMPEWGWSDLIVLVAFASGIGLLSIFVLVEKRIDSPLIDLGLFVNASFTVCNLTVFAAQFSKITVIIFGAQYLQESIGMSPLAAGIALLVGVGCIPLVAGPAGAAADRYGSRRPILLGLLLITVGILLISILVDWNNYLMLIPALLIWGAGVPFCFVAPRHMIMNAVPASKKGQAGGIVMTAQLLGSTISMAVCSMVYATTQNYQLVFLITASLTLVILVMGYFSIDHDSGTTL